MMATEQESPVPASSWSYTQVCGVGWHWFASWHDAVAVATGFARVRQSRYRVRTARRVPGWIVERAS